MKAVRAAPSCRLVVVADFFAKGQCDIKCSRSVGRDHGYRLLVCPCVEVDMDLAALVLAAVIPTASGLVQVEQVRARPRPVSLHPATELALFFVDAFLSQCALMSLLRSR